MKRKVGVHLLLADHADDFINHHAVLEHEQVRIEDVALGRAHVLDNATLHFDELLAGPDERLLEPAHFPGDFRVRKFTPRDGMPDAMQDKDFPAANASRNGYAAIQLFSLKLT
jgi:hypothetical protein